MIDYRPILYVIGILLCILAAAMGLPAIVDFASGNTQDGYIFGISAAMTLFVGGGLILANRTEEFHLDIRQAFVLTTTSWVVIAAFAALPFAFSALDLDFADAYFEAMSGITTTGSTVIVGLDWTAPGILLWRALLQWLGGIGIIGMAVAILPMLQVGGMQLFRMESSDRSGKVFPRARQIAGGIVLTYVALTAACAFLMWLAGMTGFEAVTHAMTTLSTGGFSTSDASISHFDSVVIDSIVILFMILGALPFVLYLHALYGHPERLWRDTQVHWFFGITAIAIMTLTIWEWIARGEQVLTALRYAAFNVVSIITTTGYTTAPYDTWGGFAVIAFFFLIVVGGCAGSTAGGIKTYRFQVIASAARVQIQRLMQPHRIAIVYYNRQPVPEQVASSVMGFFFLFALTFCLLVLGLGLLGTDFLTAMSGAATAVANVGPGLGTIIGAKGDFSSLPDAAKWLLSFGMLVGRLEVYTVLVLFAPAFWRG